MNDKRQETAKQEKQELQPGKMGEEREREREVDLQSNALVQFSTVNENDQYK